MKLQVDRWLGTQGHGGANFAKRTWHASYYGWICKGCNAYNILRDFKGSLDVPILCPYCKIEHPRVGWDYPVDEILEDYDISCPRCRSNHVFTTLMGTSVWNHVRCYGCQAVYLYRKNREGLWEISYSRV